MNSNIKFGKASVDITPPFPASLQGQFYERIATAAESRLFAKAIAVESGSEHFVICSCDLVGIDSNLVTKVRERLSVRCPDFKADNLIISATHTHSAPICVEEPCELAVGAHFLPENKKYVANDTLENECWTLEKNIEFFADKIADAVSTAWDSRWLGWYMPSFGRAVTGHSRRMVYRDGSALMYGQGQRKDFLHLESGSDTGVELLYLYDEYKNLSAAIVNVACPSQVLEHSDFISSDYWGKARNLLKRDFGKNFMLLGLCSAAGCQSPRDLVRDLARSESVELDVENANKRRQDSTMMWTIAGAEELGRRIRNVVVESLPDVTRLKRQVEIVCRKKVFDLPLRYVTKEAYEKARTSFLKKVEDAGKDVFTRDDMQMLHLDGGIIQRYLMQQSTKTYPAEVLIAKIDDMAFVTNPFELFLDYGNQLKAKSPAAQTFVIQLANGYSGYVPTERAEQGGHYSAYVASGMIGHEGGQMLVDESLKELDEIF